VVAAADRAEAALRDAIDRYAFKSEAFAAGKSLERVKGIEPSYSAWKAQITCFTKLPQA
jgi:hypothetical protein